jgi:hypothetical protein
MSATGTIPAGNSTNSDRYARSLIAREAAFTYLMDRKTVNGAIVPLTQVERDTLLNRAIKLLESINTDVDVGTFWTFYNPWQNRSKELTGYLIAYDLLRGAGVSGSQLTNSKTKLLTFTANLYQRSMASYTFLNLKFFTYQFNNHSIMTASTLGLAAVVFNNNTSTNTNYQPQNWINAGLYNLDNTLWVENGTYPRVSEPDTMAGYAEGPNYFKYGFENAFPFIRAMGNFLPDGYYSVTFNNISRNIRNPWYDTRYDRIYDWLNRIRMPDGSFPSIHDSYMGFSSPIAALSGKPQFNWMFPGFNSNDPIFRTQYIATNVAHGAMADSPFQALPAAGSLVFRSAWQQQAVYMHFIGKHGIALTGAKAHHQGDASSFSLAAYGELLAVDPGYPGASQAELENKAVDHSLVLVNGAGPLPPTGETVSTSTNTAYIENYFDTPVLDYGEVRVNYSGVEVVRKNLFVRNKYFILTDFMTASSAKSYTFQLHGNGLFGSVPTAPTGSFTPAFSQGKGLYQRNGVTLLAHIAAPGAAPVFSYDQDSMVISGGFRRYSRMLAMKSNQTNTIFLTTLYPYTNTTPVVEPGVQRSQATSVKVQAEGFRDLVFCSYSGSYTVIPSDSSGLSKVVKGNGKINFLSENLSGKFAAAFIESGDSLTGGGQTIVKASKNMDVAWMYLDTTVACGFVSDSAVVKLISTGPMQKLSGPVQSVSWSPSGGFSTVVFSGSGNFMLGRQNLTWIWSGNSGTSWHDPDNWNLSGFSSIHGVPAETNNVYIPSGAVNMPVVASPEVAACHNLTIAQNASLMIELTRFLTVGGDVKLEY